MTRQTRRRTTGSQRCVWKTVVENSLNGLGTSYDTHLLNRQQRDCVGCSGTDRSCRTYSVWTRRRDQTTGWLDCSEERPIALA